MIRLPECYFRYKMPQGMLLLIATLRSVGWLGRSLGSGRLLTSASPSLPSVSASIHVTKLTDTIADGVNVALSFEGINIRQPLFRRTKTCCIVGDEQLKSSGIMSLLHGLTCVC